MEGFRYAQFCPLARATEILAHRWVLLVLRELFLGPQRFSDLRRRLPGLSSSVLANRLTALEARGIVVRKDLPPPAPATIYELGEAGRALEPVLMELARWGVRFLLPPVPGDHLEPDWLHMACAAFARRGPTPGRRFELRARGSHAEARLRVAGGPDGTHPIEDRDPVDLTLWAPVRVVMGLMTGRLAAEQALGRGDVRVEGDRGALSDLPALFELVLPPSNP